ncbi:MAG TPA: Gfo/Idh/MocA family oxidoreductase [Candidatus Saccharimonadales bacterium]|nr:Gfo/Idh/MocA family oxidoreductase [Candidatus Saccharimonadales bacterium]
MATRSTVGIALIGAGRWGPNLLRNFNDDPRSQVLWVVDRDPERLAAVAMRYPGVQLSPRIRDPLADPEVCAIVIATPAGTHAELARHALVAGKHCLVEKPLATNSVDAVGLVQLAQSRRCILAVGHVFLHNPAIRHAKACIDDGRLGHPYYASMVRTNLGPPGIDVNVAWDLATHDVSIATYWFGDPPLFASARGGCWISPGREDTIFATLLYPRDRLVHIVASWLSPRKVREITLVGSRSMVTIDDMNTAEPVRVHDKGIDAGVSADFVDSHGAFRASIRDGEVRIPRVAMGEPLREECEDFLDCILTGRAPVASGASALSTVRTIEAINRSLRNGGCQEPV